MTEGDTETRYQKGDKVEFIVRDQPDYSPDRKKEQSAIGVVDNVTAYPTRYTVYTITVPHGKKAGLHIVEERDIISKKE